MEIQGRLRIVLGGEEHKRCKQARRRARASADGCGIALALAVGCMTAARGTKRAGGG